MRSVGLDLGVRHIAYCEVLDGKVINRTTVRSLSELKSRLGPGTAPARVGFEACREAWHVHDKLMEWGHEPLMLDSTRVREIGVGHHRRKNDPIDAEAIAQAVDTGRIPLAHVLSPARRALRAKLSVRGALVETRAQYVTTIRGLARAAGVLLPTCHTQNFVAKVRQSKLDQDTQELVAPLITVLETLEHALAKVEKELSDDAQKDPVVQLCATAPGVGLIVAATFVSVIDEAQRFNSASAVGAYLGLVPSESTTGGPKNRRLGAITKQGNSRARAMLVQASWQVLRSRDREDALTIWGNHIANTRGKKIAVIAVARKLAAVMWAMWRDGTVYDRVLQTKRSADGIETAGRKQQQRAAALRRAAGKLQRKDPNGAAQPRKRGPTRRTSSETSAMQ